MNKNELIYVLQLLISSKVTFSLIREVNLENLKGMADFDIFMTSNNYFKFISFLNDNKIPYKFVNPYVLNKKQLLISGVLLDIDIDFISYDLYKCIGFKPDISKINSNYKVLNITLPIFCKSYLFTIWLLHFILDKKDFSGGSTSLLFYKKYKEIGPSELECLKVIINSLTLTHETKIKLLSTLFEYKYSMIGDLDKGRRVIVRIHNTLNRDLKYKFKFAIVRFFFAIFRRVNFG